MLNTRFLWSRSNVDPLAIDLYEPDCPDPDWSLIEKANQVDSTYPWAAVILKATEGVIDYSPAWFARAWASLQNTPYFVGAYHYWRAADKPEAQGEALLTTIQKAGGLYAGVLPLIIDVESANNPSVTKNQVTEDVSRLADHLYAESGLRPILYGHELLYTLGIKSHLGCQKLWMALYSDRLPAHNDKFGGYDDLGWELHDVVAWQYCGDGNSRLVGYPDRSPLGKTDISALIVNGGGNQALEWMDSNCF